MRELAMLGGGLDALSAVIVGEIGYLENVVENVGHDVDQLQLEP